MIVKKALLAMAVEDVYIYIYIRRVRMHIYVYGIYYIYGIAKD